MKPVESKLSSQGQVSVPARIRRKLGLSPGSRIEWCERGEEVVVRRSSKFSSRDIHEAVFRTAPDRRSLADMDEGIPISHAAASCAPLTPTFWSV